jgi:uncharacterized membrane protein
MDGVPARPSLLRPRWLRLRAEGDEIRHLLGTAGGRLLVAAVAVICAFTLIGLLALWPYGWDPPGNASAGTVPATVKQVVDAPCTEAGDMVCRTIVVEVEGREVPLNLQRVRNAPAVGVGDTVRLMRSGDPTAQPQADGFVHYDFAEVDRRGSLLWLAVLLAVVSAAFLRWRGVLAVLGVALSLAVVVWFLVPAMLAGKPTLLVALVASLVVTFVTIVLTNGLGTQTLAGILGVTATLLLTCLLGWLAVRFADLDGTTELDMLAVRAGSDILSLQGVILAGMIIGALGVIADTAVTQASAVMGLRRANPRYGRRTLYREGFIIGRDHLSATIHTLVLAYSGAVLPLLLVTQMGHVNGLDAVNGQSLAVPIVATIVGCLALIAAVPITTGLAAMLLSRIPADALPEAHGHHHH